MYYCSRLLLKANKNLTKHYFKHTWIKPKGFDTGIKVYNCITRKKEPLILKNKYLITWYTCGPTVYDSSHIGHACCYVKLDIIQNILRHYFLYNLITVMNITDIDDKIINKSMEIKRLYRDIAKEYEKQFLIDLESLGINEHNIILKVTENMDLIIDFIKNLVENGYAYKTEDNSVYFDTEHYSNYGKLQNIGQQNIQQAPNNYKKADIDFVLWKSNKENEPFWHSPWGTGRPGWHIECSALASHILGSNIDIHAGGMDLKFPHHENEEAQSCAYHGAPQWVNYWLHTGHLHLKNSEKMSKSLKNTISIQEMLRDTDPNIFRMACIMSHYRSNMEYSKELMMTAENVLKIYKNFLDSCDNYRKGYIKCNINNDLLTKALQDAFQSIHDALCDDFDTPSVIKLLNDLVSTTNSMLHADTASNLQSGICPVLGVSNFVTNILSIFGIKFHNKIRSSEDFKGIMNILNIFRQEVRLKGIENKDADLLKLSDNIRNELKDFGITIKDHGKISSWSK